jgi:dTDP-4-dehydrorhamnose 3,5-epimerase/CDP-3, 6-dideoxy-D-glycero-D-glycero-4-hexulose-5-epimerase
MMIENTLIPDVKIIHQFRAEDARGHFVKTYHQSSLAQAGIHFEMKESFYSVSKKNAIRGLHFQHPPYQHAKIVFCTEGAILDVALDIRKDSLTYGQFVTAELSAENNCALYIPEGFAHGFKTLTEGALTFYFVSSENVREADDGILYHSIGLDWQCESPIVSVRDQSFKSFQDFQSPF